VTISKSNAGGVLDAISIEISIITCSLVFPEPDDALGWIDNIDSKILRVSD